MLQGKDKQWSLRRVMALMCFGGIFFHITYCTIKNQNMNDGAIASLSALIAALLGLTTWQNTKTEISNTEELR